MTQSLNPTTVTATQRRMSARHLIRVRRRWLWGIVLLPLTLFAWMWWDERPIRRIDTLLRRQEFSQALTLSNEFLRDHPDRGAVEEMRGQALVGLRRWDDAIKLFERTGVATSAGERSWSIALLHRQRWSDALPLLVRLHQQSPRDADVLHELIACHGKLGFVDDALRLAQKLSELPGQEARGWLMIGTLHSNQQNHKLTIIAWQHVLDDDPTAEHLQIPAHEFFAEFGRAYLKDGQPRAAIPLLETSLTLRATGEAQSRLADACELTGDAQRAISLWQQAVASDSSLSAPRVGLARLELQQQRAREALDWLAPLLERSELESSTAYLAQRAYTLLGDVDQTAAWKDKVAALRRREQRQAMIDAGMQRAPQSYWARAVRAHRFASEGNLPQSAQLAAALQREAAGEPFVQQLIRSLQTGAPLPSLDAIPVKQF